MPRIPRCQDSVPDRTETVADLRAWGKVTDKTSPREAITSRTMDLITEGISQPHRRVLRLSR